VPLFADGTNQFADDKARTSYAYGMITGHQWKTGGADFDLDAYFQGLKDEFAGHPTQLTPEQAQQVFDNFRKEYAAKQQQKRTELTAKNKADGQAFLTTNKLVPDVKLLAATLPTGQPTELQYQVLTAGTGPIPKIGDHVKVNYRGTFLDGTEFDSSYKRNQPFPCQVGAGVIQGWSVALENMPVGSKWKLFIPSELAYGERGNGGIPPNAVLIFEVELLSIDAPPAPAPAPAPAAPLTSDIIKVPSAEELKKGAKIEVIKPEDIQKAQTNQNDQK